MQAVTWDADDAGFWNAYPATPGTRIYTFKYKMSGSCAGFYRNRALWVQVIPPAS
jgi:hypothetical protein